jgi:sulfatase modifying factor 1
LLMGQNPAQCAHGCGDDLPVQNVSWYDTLRFMNRLTDRENSAKPPEAWRSRCYDETTWRWDRACTGYRLPTEAEWEYAARAGSTTAYAFGDDPAMLCEYGNGADIATMSTLVTWYDCNETCNDHAGGLSAVGAYRPNAWGLLDMHGNVYEWVWDVYAPYAVDRLDEPLPPPDALRVLRGGSFLSDPGTMRSAYRRGGNPQQRNMIMGVRCARSSDPSVSSR